ncbi:uncharacterized protein LOC141533609 [Cotesia typhae]|uniref:uncharacterized protein LOC141533609 n=1 Tax=Cotesia typhae TaxID=2053667 RepID=UPI003D699C70
MTDSNSNANYQIIDLNFNDVTSKLNSVDNDVDSAIESSLAFGSDISSEQSDREEDPDIEKSQVSTTLTEADIMSDDEKFRLAEFYKELEEKAAKKKKNNQNTKQQAAEEEKNRGKIIHLRYKQAVVDYLLYSGASQEEVVALFKPDRILKSVPVLSKWKSYVLNVRQGGKLNKIDRKDLLDRLVYGEYRRRREFYLPVKGQDLINIAKDVAQVEKITFAGKKFVASKTWLHYFKKRHSIVSRKITHYLYSVRDRNKAKEIITTAKFVLYIRNDIEKFGAENVFNADESGYQYEFLDKRTLDDKGVKDVKIVGDQKNMTRTSYTIMPAISAAGELLPRVLIVLREKKGYIGPDVASKLFTSPNLFITAGKGGKTSGPIVDKWFEKVYLPATGEKTILLLDAATTRKKEALKKLLIDNGTPDKVTIRHIPGGWTSVLQPCDQYFFRGWKHYVKEFQREIKMYPQKFMVYERNNILMIQAFTHNQLSSPKWRQAIVKSWEDCNYTERDRDERFTNAVDWAFRDNDVLFERNKQCEIGSCENPTLIRCLRCKKSICMNHCFWMTESKYYIHYHGDHGKLLSEQEFDEIRPDPKEYQEWIQKRNTKQKKSSTSFLSISKRKGKEY